MIELSNELYQQMSESEKLDEKMGASKTFE